MCKDRRVEFIIHSERMQLGFFFFINIFKFSTYILSHAIMVYAEYIALCIT